jgi:hypothetical protein
MAEPKRLPKKPRGRPRPAFIDTILKKGHSR